MTRPFAAALLMADADDAGELAPLSHRLLQSLGPVDVGDVHAAWVAACIAAVEGWDDLQRENLATVRHPEMIEAAQQATRWVQASVSADHWLTTCQQPPLL